MISISLCEKFCCQNLITSIKVINMMKADWNLVSHITRKVSFYPVTILQDCTHQCRTGKPTLLRPMEGVGLELVYGRPTLTLGSALVHQTKQLQTTKTKRIKHKQKAKRAAVVEGQVATMLKSHTRQIDTIDITGM